MSLFNPTSLMDDIMGLAIIFSVFISMVLFMAFGPAEDGNW